MKKILNKIKNIFIGMFIFINTLPSKIFAIVNDTIFVEIQPLYGITYDEPVRSNIFWGLAKYLSIPLILIIGLIIYHKKAKKSLFKKVITEILIALIIIFSLLFILNLYDIIKSY